MKTTEQVNKEFDEEFSVVDYDVEEAQRVKSFISSLRKSDIEALEEWVKNQKKKTRFETDFVRSITDAQEFGENTGHNRAIHLFSAHLQELKKEI